MGKDMSFTVISSSGREERLCVGIFYAYKGSSFPIVTYQSTLHKLKLILNG